MRIKDGAIVSISGRLGNKVYKTFRKADGSCETRAYLYRKYERSVPVSEHEREVRSRFAKFAAYYQGLTEAERRDFYAAWQRDKYCFNGKRYVTLRGYVMARSYAEGRV